MCTSLAVQNETTHEPYAETRHSIPRLTIGVTVSVFSGSNFQLSQRLVKSYPIRPTSCRESPLT